MTPNYRRWLQTTLSAHADLDALPPSLERGVARCALCVAVEVLAGRFEDARDAAEAILLALDDLRADQGSGAGVAPLRSTSEALPEPRNVLTQRHAENALRASPARAHAQAMAALANAAVDSLIWGDYSYSKGRYRVMPRSPGAQGDRHYGFTHPHHLAAFLLGLTGAPLPRGVVASSATKSARYAGIAARPETE